VQLVQVQVVQLLNMLTNDGRYIMSTSRCRTAGWWARLQRYPNGTVFTQTPWSVAKDRSSVCLLL